jgi:hypothetical protein
MKIIVLPDVQARDGIDFSFLTSIGNFILKEKADCVVNIGDFADMESLSTYDRGLKSFEGKRYTKDIWAARQAMDALLTPIYEYNAKAKKNKEKQYKPRMVLTLGNHENRINRAVNEDSKLDGLISTDDLPYQDWEVYPFLDVVTIEGVAFSHYFTSGLMGRPIGTAQQMLNKLHMSAFAGHQQGRQVAYGKTASGKPLTAIICGSCYEHDEAYLGPQGNNHFRGLYVLNDVKDGSFNEVAVPLSTIVANF